MAASRGMGMIEKILGDLMGLSLEESILLFPRWMEGADLGQKVAIFAAWMTSEKDIKLKRTLFVDWMAVERRNRKFLKDICVKAVGRLRDERVRPRQHIEDRGVDGEGIRERYDPDARQGRAHGQELLPHAGDDALLSEKARTENQGEDTAATEEEHGKFR